MGYLNSLDLANRACQHLGNRQILAIDEDSKANFELAFAYDKLRRAELRRNTWRFGTRTTILRPVSETTFMFRPALWSATTLYLPGAVVRDANNAFWQSTTPENINNIPGQSPMWGQYFGSMTVDLHDDTESYFAGDLVYVLGDAGSYVIYLSLRNGNETTPGTAVEWDVATTFGLNSVASYGGYQWRSLLNFNLGNIPTTQAAEWDSEAVYGTGYLATGDDGYCYISQHENNVGNYPPTAGSTHWLRTGQINAWSKVPTIYPSDPNWLPLYASVNPMYLVFPIGYGPDLQTGVKQLYRLPCNYLRECPRDPKAGSVSIMGAPSGLLYNDWLFQGDYLLTGEPGPLMFRFVADITVVAEMDDMFCEALAARMALGTVETITSSDKKKSLIQSEYTRWIAEARLVNGIEIGAEEAPEDDWLTCRM